MVLHICPASNEHKSQGSHSGMGFALQDIYAENPTTETGSKISKLKLLLFSSQCSFQLPVTAGRVHQVFATCLAFASHTEAIPEDWAKEAQLVKSDHLSRNHGGIHSRSSKFTFQCSNNSFCYFYGYTFL